jgi:excisionase family DNA binding protein
MSENTRQEVECQVLTVPEIAKILGVGKANAYNLVKQDVFPVIKIGRQLKVPKQAFYRWFNNQ